jgi:hypothetical protein
MKYSETLEKFLDQEKKLAGIQVLAPVIPGGKVRITVGHLVWETSLETEFSGWGILEVLPSRSVRFVREAEEWEKEAYAKTCIKRPFLLFHRDKKGVWWGYDFKENLTAPIYLASEVSLFDSVITIEDKGIFWYLFQDRGCGWTRRKALCESLEKDRSPEDLRISGLSLQEKEVYRLAFLLNQEKSYLNSEKNILEALKTGGGELQELTRVEHGYRVKWGTSQGESFVSVVDPGLNLISAGICLRGEEKKQDFTSLVSLVSQRNAPRTQAPEVPALTPSSQAPEFPSLDVFGNNALYSQIPAVLSSLSEELKFSPKDLTQFFDEIKKDLKNFRSKYEDLKKNWMKAAKLFNQVFRFNSANSKKNLQEVKARIEAEMAELLGMLQMLLTEVMEVKVIPRLTDPDRFSKIRDSLRKHITKLEILKEISQP